MINIIVALPKPEEAKGIRNILMKNGFLVTAVCTTGAQALSHIDELNDGIIICGYKLADMMYSELHECLPAGFDMLLMLSHNVMNDCLDNNIVCLSMPLKVHDLIDTLSMMCQTISRRRKKANKQPRVRNEKEELLIKEAKELLMTRNNMTEEEAYRYIQKSSMDSGSNMVETAQMILIMMKV